MACIVMLVIILLALILGAELGPKADPTTTTYVPRPEWYFFFLFELLRIIKPALLVANSDKLQGVLGWRPQFADLRTIELQHGDALNGAGARHPILFGR